MADLGFFILMSGHTVFSSSELTLAYAMVSTCQNRKRISEHFLANYNYYQRTGGCRSCMRPCIAMRPSQVVCLFVCLLVFVLPDLHDRPSGRSECVIAHFFHPDIS